MLREFKEGGSDQTWKQCCKTQNHRESCCSRQRILGKAEAGAVWGQGQSSQCGEVCGEAKVGTELGVGCGGALWSWTEHSKGFNGLRDLGQPLP